MRVALRVDASAEMGTGHLRRCLSLAEALAEQGAEAVLVVRALDDVARQVLRQTNHAMVWLPPAAAGGTSVSPAGDLPPHHAWSQVPWQQDAKDTCAALRDTPPDWLIVDHYAFDARWHDAVRQGLGCRVLVVDDIADRPLSADILLDHNWAPDHREKYRGRLTREPVWLTGPRFALLSPAYRSAPRYCFNADVRSLGIFMGGTDPGGITAQVLDCIRNAASYTGPVEVVSTSANPHLRDLQAACTAWPDTVLTLDEPDLAGFFARHDLHIGAGGGATWERCCIGVPTIALVVADNQAASVPWLHDLGVLHAAHLPGVEGTQMAGAVPPLADVLSLLIRNAGARRLLGAGAAALVDGRGAERVALHLTRESVQLRPAAAGDASMLYAWRNHPTVRGVSLNTAPIDYRAHIDWIDRSIRAVDRWLYVAQVGQLPVGTIRFDQVDTSTLEVSLYLDPDLQGLGLGKQMLRVGERTVSQQLERDVAVHAVVSPENGASIRLFQSNGYDGGPPRFRKHLKHQSQLLESAQ